MNILDLVKEKEKRVIEIRRDLHKIPELGRYLPKTCDYVKNILDEIGVNYDNLVDGNAFVVKIFGKESGPCIAIRADMDGLPIKEETGLPFTSTNENMHACGHDGHTAMALGACMILNENRDKFKGCVKIFFQPAEEGPGGAKIMIEEGCMNNPKVDAVIGLHEGYLIPVTSGKIGVKTGAIMASIDGFSIEIKGKGAHGATPHLSNDPLNVMCELVMSLQKIISRELNPLSNAVLTVGQFHSGSAGNIIPDNAKIDATVRTLDPNDSKFISKRVHEIAHNIAKAFNCEAIVNYNSGVPAVMNNDKFTKFFIDNTKEVLGENSIEIINKPSMASEDMAYFLNEAPGVFFMLSNPKIHENGKIYDHHTSRFDIDESQFYKGMSAILSTVFKFLS